MGFVRKFLLVIITPFLLILLFAMAFDFGVLHVVGSPTPIKHILADSGIYNNVISSALDQAQRSAGASNNVSLTDPAIKSAAQSSFTPQVVQQSTEQAINGVYDWLNGKTPQPDFSVDLTSTKSDFAQKVGQAAQQRAASLPVCKSAPESADPLSVTCLPPGVTPAQVGQEAQNDVLNAQGFLEHPVITADTIKKSGSDQSVFSSGKLQNVPKQYQRIKKSPFILAALTILVIVAIIFLSASRRKGIRRVSTTLMIAGVILLLLAWGLNKEGNQKLIPKIQFDNKVLQTDVQKLAGDLLHDVNQNFQLFGGTYVAIGVLAVGCTLLIGRGNKKVPVAEAAGPAKASTSSKPVYKAPAPPTRKVPPKIQG